MLIFCYELDISSNFVKFVLIPLMDLCASNSLRPTEIRTCGNLSVDAILLYHVLIQSNQENNKSETEER